ncbi:MAG TPA: hypothetical protein VNL73_05150 [Verrucomicrobiae bacterium]|nr:hypothetical protein [Verrucomicrobiae bacterium]
MVIKLDTIYEVASGKVTLSVIIGEAQLGSSLVKLNDVELGIGQINNLSIGRGSDIAGKTLFIKTVVTDVNDKTNLTSVGYVFKGGKVDKRYDLNATVNEEGGSVIYRANFKLIA